MRWLNQVVQITLINLSNLPQRTGTSLVVVIVSWPPTSTPVISTGSSMARAA